jgi:sugar phosphate permease
VLDASTSGSKRRAADEPCTRARYGVLAYAVAMAVILYLDRMSISVAMPAIAADLGLPIARVADSVAAFFWCYALFQVPAGWLGDRIGGRRALTLYVVAWSLAMAGLGLVGGLASLVLMRGLLGIGQAGAYATTAGFLRHWMPFSVRGFANSAVSLGGRAGGVLAPALTSLLMAAAAILPGDAARWRPVFIGYALVGWVWAWLFWRWFRDTPAEHPSANGAEAALIAGAERPTEKVPGTFFARRLVASRSLWVLGLINFTINVGWILVGTLLPTYLIRVHGQSEIQAGFATSLVAAAGMAGCLTGGLATDRLVRRLGLAWGRRVPCIASYGGAAIAYGICFGLEQPAAIVTLLVLASFLGDFGLGALWCTYQDIGRAYSGTVLGVGNMCGNIGAAIATSLVPRLAEAQGWSASFALSAGAYAVAAVAWLAVDPHKPIAEARPAESPPAETPRD